jgi:acetyl esterase/lipase
MRHAVAVLAVLLAVPAFAASRSWTGTVDTNWSNPLNWNPVGVPAAADEVTFPGTQSRRNVVFDMPAGTSVGPMTFLGEYSVSGNRMTLTGDVAFNSSPSVACLFYNDFTIGASLAFRQALYVTIYGAVDVGGHTLSFLSTNTTVLSGPLTGTGTINADRRGVTFLGGGTFSGNVEGYAFVGGAYPNATFHSPWLTGTGTAGAVTADLLSPGEWWPGSSGDPHTISTLHTGSLSIGSQLSIDIDPIGNLEQVDVTGTVTLAGTLAVTMGGTWPPLTGMRFPIIVNDGSDPVSGTFAGLPEGATFTVGSYTFWITYKGGDGNDVVLTAGPPMKTWIGTNSGQWSDPGNWQPRSIPAAGEPLLFPPYYGRAAMTNDLPAGFTPGPLTINFNYTLGGNLLTLTNDLNFAASPYSATLTCDAPLKLGNSIHINSGQTTFFNGPIDLSGNTLTVGSFDARFRGPIDGSGAIAVTGPGISLESSGSFSGPISGTVNVAGAYPNAAVTGKRVSGEGTLGAVTAGTVAPGSWLPASVSPPHQVATLQTGSLSISSGTIIDIDPGGGTADRIKVNGTVSLAGPLQLFFITAPSAGQSWTIIDNDGTDPVNGTFDNLPEGASFSAGGYGGVKIHITYKGGDGNDVVIGTDAGAAPTTTAVAQDRDTTDVHQPVTFTAIVTSSGGTPTGTVSFLDESTMIGSALLQNGSATFTTSDLAVGDHRILASYTTNGSFRGSTSTPILHTVVSGAHTATAVTQDRDATGLHQPVTFTATVTTSGSGTPTGTVTFFDGSNAIGSSALQGGTAALTTPELAPGDHQITAAYLGDSSFAPSTSAAIVHHVDGGGSSASTATTIAQDRDTTEVHQAVTFTARVTSGGGMPTGSVAFLDGSTIIGSAALQGGAAAFTTSDLALGDHQITAAYTGNASFAASTSAAIVHHVVSGSASTAVTIAQNRDTTEVHQPVTFTATVTTSGSGTPIGSVSFLDGSTTIGSATLQGGSAAFTTKDLALGDHQISAAYSGDPSFGASSSAPIVHHVVKGSPQLSATPSQARPAYGDSVTFTVSVARGVDSVDGPGGSVSLDVDHVPSGTAPLSAGSATISVPLLAAGTHRIDVAYSGDAEFNASSAASSLTVSKAAATLIVDSPVNPSPAGVPVTLSVHVSAPAHPSLPVEGTVYASSGGRIVAQAQLARGAASMALASFAGGDHELTASYAGNANFEAATAALTQHVAAPALSIANAALAARGTARDQVVQVELSAASTLLVTVDYRTADATAVAGADYVAAQGTITFAPGQTSAEIPIRLLANAAAAPQAQFTVELSNASGASILTPRTTVTIAHDERTYRTPVDYTYQTVDGVPLRATFYAPAAGDGPWPLILWIPGDTAYDAPAAAPGVLRETTRGYAVVSIAYRPAAAAPFPAQIDDLRAAVAWLRANAPMLGVDAKRIAAWGVGAGGHLAALLGTGADVQAVVDWSGISDPSTLQSDALACSMLDWNAPTSPAALLLGCPPSQCPASTAAAAPSRFAAATAAPMLLMHGDADCFIAPSQSTHLYDAMKRAGADVTLRLLPGVGHDDAFWTTAAAFAEAEGFLDARLKGGSPRPRPVRH